MKFREALSNAYRRSQVWIAGGLLAMGMGAIGYGQGFLLNNLVAGNALQPTIAGAADTTTGVFFPSAGLVGLSVAGTQVGQISAVGVQSANTGRFEYCTVPVGSVAYGSFGNATTNVNGTILWADLNVLRSFTATGIKVLNAGTIGTDKGLVGLYNAGGTLIANSATAGATTAGANAFQTYNFTAPLAILGPARFWAGYQANGTTDNIRTVATLTFPDVLTTSTTGAFGTLTTLTPPTTFTANVGPIACLF